MAHGFSSGTLKSPSKGMSKTGLTCGACRTLVITIVEHLDRHPEVRLAPNGNLHFDLDHNCTFVCGSCGAVTSAALPKALAAVVHSWSLQVPSIRMV